MTEELTAKRVWTTPSLEILEMKETRNGITQTMEDESDPDTGQTS